MKLKTCPVCKKKIPLCPSYHLRKTCSRKCGSVLTSIKTQDWWRVNKNKFMVEKYQCQSVFEDGEVKDCTCGKCVVANPVYFWGE